LLAALLRSCSRLSAADTPDSGAGDEVDDGTDDGNDADDDDIDDDGNDEPDDDDDGMAW
jgi:hypothetical protein